MTTLSPLRVRLCIVMLTCAQLLGCSAEPEPSPPPSLSAWLDIKHEEHVMRSPMRLTYLGRPERKSELDEFSWESYQADLRWRADTVAEMTRLFDRAQLNDAEKLSFDLWQYSYDRSVAAEPFFYSGLVFDQMNGVHTYLPTFLINFHRVETLEDFKALLARVALVKTRLAEALALAQESTHAAAKPLL